MNAEVKPTRSQRKEQAVYDKALKKFQEARPNFNSTELKALEGKPFTLTDQTIKNGDNHLRRSIVAQKNGDSITFEVNEQIISHHVRPGKKQDKEAKLSPSFWGKTNRTFTVTLYKEQVETIKAGHNFTYLSDTNIADALNPENPLQPASDISTVEDIAKKTEVLNIVTSWLPPLEHPARLG